MSNARNLANLLGNGTTIATASIADDAITAVKIDDDGTGFTFGDLTVAGAVVGDGFTSVDKLKLDGSSVATVTVNSAVSASATIAVDGVSGTIVVGMVVNVSDISVRSISDAASQTAISTDDSLTITAVASQTSFTVSEAVTIADNVVLILRSDENQAFLLDASAASTDVGEEVLFEDATGDPSVLSGLAGSVLRVVHESTIVPVSQSGNTTAFVDTTLSASITPSSSSSKILVTGYVSYLSAAGSNGNDEFNFAVCDGSNNILDGTTADNEGYKINQAYHIGGKHTINFLHLPNTTSSFTYKMRMNAKNSNNSLVLHCQKGGTGNNISRITLTEIAG